jgi:heme/copper-type cytochrome/quinol oxidase subunit 2
MKRFILITLATFVFSTAVHAQSAEPPVVTISANHSAFAPNEITLKRGELVTLRVTSTDRIRSFHSRELGFDVDIRPKPREISVSPDKAGRFVVTGSSPGDIKLVINVEEAS